MSTVGEKFRGQLNRLMDAVNKTKPYFIRCIKPNHAKAPQQLQMKMVIEQLTYAGVFEAVKIRKSGYPFRLPHAEFAATYRWIARKVRVTVGLGSAFSLGFRFGFARARISSS